LRASIAAIVVAGPSFGARLGDSFLNAGSGDITALLPSNLSVTIRAQNESISAGMPPAGGVNCLRRRK
jgi:hypothetical protein